MEEKERYEWDAIEGVEWIRDTKIGYLLYRDDMKKLADLLNKQDKQIKELEEQLSTATMYHGCEALVNELKQKNQQLKQQLEETKQNCNYQVMLMCQKENILLNQQLKQAQNKKAIEELEGLQVQCQFDITFADYKQEQRLYDYINDRIKELKGEKK